MTTPCNTIITVTDATGAGEARRQLNRIAEQSGLGEASRGRAAIIVTELATNLAKHTAGGEILLRSIDSGADAPNAVEIMSIDRGPGMADISRCMEDGYSTTGTAGDGLGAVRRQANEFDVYSSQPTGTVALARVTESSPSPAKRPTFAWGVVSRPAPRELECGDSWRLTERPGEFAILLVDGLGHGPDAAKAAEAATGAFDADPFAPHALLFDRAGAAMRGTRGGAVAAARIDAAQRTLVYAGVGNIAGNLRSLIAEDGPNARGLVSHNGIVGVQQCRTKEMEYPCPREGLLVMYSDGLQSRWALDSYPGLAMRHPAVIAGVLYRDFTRGRDDVTVAVVRFSFT